MTAPRSLRVVLFNKPYGVLSQFSPGLHHGLHQTLNAFGPFPPDVYPVGRLDADSEGLLLLTNSALLKHRLLLPRFAHRRTYLVQVERVPNARALRTLCNGTIQLGNRRVLPAEVRRLPDEPALPPRPVPIRFRKTVSTAWLEISLREGRNRQIRKMTAAVGHPTLRLVRISIGSLTLEGLAPGDKRSLSVPESLRFYDEIVRGARD
jgi:23S rRNA pseudouridine2457 synthase